MITVVGGGLGGLLAAISAAEAGAEVELLERSAHLGGRARSPEKDGYRPNFGAHALYANGPLWRWLTRRRLAPKSGGSPMTSPLAFRLGGRRRRTPPLDFVRPLLHRRLTAPVERDFGEWASERFGERAAGILASSAGVFTFHHDPSRLAAAFVWERLLRVTAMPAVTRYPHGGWSSLVDRLERRASDRGVRIVKNAPVEELPKPPVIVALPLDKAAGMLGQNFQVPSGKAVLVDIALEHSRRLDPQLVSDLDQAGFVENYGLVSRDMAPKGHTLLQGHIGVAPGEATQVAALRLEALLDIAFPNWRERVAWSRRQLADGRTGALDLPGMTWRDRPQVDQGGDVFLVGDQVAAPGLLSEVLLGSAIDAAEKATAALERSRLARAGWPTALEPPGKR